MKGTATYGRIVRRLGFLALVVLLAACQAEEASRETRLEAVLEHPEEHYGKTVIVSGEVAEVLSARIFTIGSEGVDERLLVVSVDSIPVVASRSALAPVAQRDLVQVTGLLRPFNRIEVAQEFGLLLDPVQFDRYENGPALIAVAPAAQMPSIHVTAQRSPTTADTTMTDTTTADTTMTDTTRAEPSGEPGF